MDFDVIPVSVLRALHRPARAEGDQSTMISSGGGNLELAVLGLSTKVSVLLPTQSITMYLHSSPSTGSYLGIDIAIKEVLPSTEYDVSCAHSFDVTLFFFSFQ